MTKLTCEFCHAFNVGRCGCLASREARGEQPTPTISVNDIWLDIKPRKARRLRG